jgi:DNA-binding NtrC family response regulator
VKVLVVDDEARNAELTALALREAGHDTEFVSGGAAALKRLAAERFDAVVTDLRMAPPDGLALLAEVRTRWPQVDVVLMTAFASLETARQALRSGAQDYVSKEGDFHGELATILDRLARGRKLTSEKARLEGEIESLKKGLATVIGDSPAMKQALDLARKVAVTDSTVLLRGESGTGKDLFARAIHFSSPRAGGPWVKVNCGALPEALLESELFGHEKGAFTGAVRQKPGRFEDANHGTLFLDEIGELPLLLQVKLLQVIEEKTFMRVGGNQPVTVDVRILAATNRELEEMVRARQFREDLFFRLNVFPIRLPSLRERAADIPALVEHAMRRHGASLEKISAPAMRALEHHHFPGNVRELEHTLERALILAGTDPVGLEHLAFSTSDAAHPGGAPSWVPNIPAEGLSLEALEKELILQALDRARGNKSQAARLLGLTRRTLYSRMERHGLRKPGEGEEAESEGAGDS